MKIVFSRVKYQNIMSVGQEPVDITLNDVHKTLITGKNGWGKSTSIEAIYFALFGKPFRDINKALLINSFNKKNMLTELWFTADSTEFYIKRGQKPTVFEVHKNGVPMDEVSSAKDFQSMLEEMIGMNSTSFKQTTILGTAGYVPFMMLKTPARRALVEDLLEVGVLGEMDKLNKTYIRELTQNISAIESEIYHLEQQISTADSYIQKQLAQNALTNDRYKVSYDLEVSKAKAIKQEIKNLKEKIAAIVIPDLPEAPDRYTEAKYKLQAGIQNYNSIIKLYSANGGDCPTCKQVLSGDSEGAKASLKAYNEKLVKVDTKLNELRNATQAVTMAKNSFNQIQNQIANAESTLKNHVSNAMNYRDMMTQVKEEAIIDYTKLNELKETRVSRVEKKSVLVLEKYNRGFVTDMLKDSGVKATVIKRYIPYFNQRIKHYLDIMGADYAFTLNESFDETIKSRGRENFCYNSFSQGEKARIDLALLFVWRDVAAMVSGSSCNILILDELFDSATDQEGIVAIKTILDSMTDNNISVISHREHDPQDYGKHIKMVKKGRFSVGDTTIF